MSQMRARTQPLLTIVLKSLVLLQKIVFYPYDEAELVQWIKPLLQKFITAADIDRQINRKLMLVIRPSRRIAWQRSSRAKDEGSS